LTGEHDLIEKPITAINATTPRIIKMIMIKNASRVDTPLRISQRVAGRTLPPIIPASRNELRMEELSFIAK
jgi:hypothetical protein